MTSGEVRGRRNDMSEERKAGRKSEWRVVKWGVIGLLGLVVALFFARGMIVASDSSDMAACNYNLKQIGLALHEYASHHDERFPQGETAAQVFSELIEAGYLGDGAMGPYPVYVCPGARQEAKEWERAGKLTEDTCSYEWVAGLTADSDPTSIVAFDKSPDNHWTRLLGITLSGRKGRNVLFVDGQVEWVGEEGFQERMEWQREMIKRMEQGGEYVGFEEGRNRETCKNHLKDIALALHAYASEHDGEFPFGETAVEVFGELIKEEFLDQKSRDLSEIPVYICPSAWVDVERWRRNRWLAAQVCSYEWMPGLNTESPREFALVFDKAANHRGEGRNVLHVDGHVSWNTEEGFQERMAWQREMMRRMKEGGEFVEWRDWEEGERGSGT